MKEIEFDLTLEESNTVLTALIIYKNELVTRKKREYNGGIYDYNIRKSTKLIERLEKARGEA